MNRHEQEDYDRALDRAVFDGLLKRRDELEHEHALACEILAEAWTATQDAKCLRLHAEIEDLQEQIDAAIAAEREE